MTSSGKPTDAIGPEKDRPAGQTHQAVLGGLMCVVALVIVGAILARPSPNAAGDHATDVSPASQPRAVTTNTRARATTAVKKPARVTPRTTVAPTTTVTTAPKATVPPVTRTTRPFVRTTVAPPGPVTAATQATTPATSPTTTPTVAVPYTPPTQKPPDTIAVPIGPSSIPTVPLVPTSLPSPIG